MATYPDPLRSAATVSLATLVGVSNRTRSRFVDLYMNNSAYSKGQETFKKENQMKQCRKIDNRINK